MQKVELQSVRRLWSDGSSTKVLVEKMVKCNEKAEVRFF